MKIGVIGAGSMGAGIAQVAATANCEVIIYDNSFQVFTQHVFHHLPWLGVVGAMWGWKKCDFWMGLGEELV